MIDCARNENSGCGGGDSCLLLEWMVQNKVNIRTEKEYPQAKNGMNDTCKVPLGDAALGLEVFRTVDFTCNRYLSRKIDKKTFFN